MNEDDVRAFEDIKKLLTSTPYLAFYTPGKPVELYTDAACKTGYGFVLKQLQADKSWRPIMVGSRALLDAETRCYAPIESELCALAWAIRKARKFLLGVPRFKVYTDYQPLVLLVNKRRLDEVPNLRLLRQLLKCRDYNFEVVYIKGTDNIAADCLSRHPAAKPDELDIAEAQASSYHVQSIQTAHLDQSKCSLKLQEIQEAGLHDPEYRALIRAIQNSFPSQKWALDPVISQYWTVRDQLSLSDDGLVLQGVRLVIPEPLRRGVMEDWLCIGRILMLP